MGSDNVGELEFYLKAPSFPFIFGTWAGSKQGRATIIMGAMSELRWHPFLGEWVITATHRQDRTFHPPADYCPLCPTHPGGFETEIPYIDYDIVVFENKFPSLVTPSPTASLESSGLFEVSPSQGICEVVCYSSDHEASMATLPLGQIQKLTRVWRDRFESLSEGGGIEYVFIFENKGKEIGVTLSHPHGQIYALPFIPPIPMRELENERKYFEQSGKSLQEEWVSQELSFSKRIVCTNDFFVAAVPFFARYPYEIHIANSFGAKSLKNFGALHLDAFASMLQTIARKYDKLFGFSLPYMMVMHQHPCRGEYGYTRFHVEFYPPFRTATKLKYLAGSESGAGAFINDTLPEDTAKVLREIVVD